ncbi:hypothetical protein SBA7_340001 [Candidatus Sulfotelmatobacter sp. SbA7]|nr:hypothetical protein SBA7_340001 [Candidatus Sulfotelmatobacter sp. SbA7]
MLFERDAILLGGPVEQVEIAAGLFHVPGDLITQGVNGRELDFVAQPLQKMNFDCGLRSQLQRMEVQQMGFDGE